MSEKTDTEKAILRYQDYVIKDGVFIGKFEEMYRDVPDPWGCVEKAGALPNRLLLSLLSEYSPCVRMLDVGCRMWVGCANSVASKSSAN